MLRANCGYSKNYVTFVGDPSGTPATSFVINLTDMKHFLFLLLLSGALLTAVPGILLQLVLIPVVMVALDRTGVLKFRQAHT